MDNTHRAPSEFELRSAKATRLNSSQPLPSPYTARETSEASSDKFEALSHFLFVLNSKSGNSQCENLKALAVTKAQLYGKTVSFLNLDPSVSLEEAIDEAVAAGAQVLVAAGGDGTVSAIATQARRVKLPLGVIPSGTANLFARELNIPLVIEAAVEQIFQCHTRLVDVVLIDKHVYLCHISVGTYSLIASNTQSPAKKKFGRGAYIFNGLKLLFKKKHWTFQLEIDGKRHVRRASTLMITNVGAMGAGNLRWTNEALPDDGQIEICVIRARTLKHYLKLFFSYLSGREHPHLQETLIIRSEARISSPSRLCVMGDGEEITQGDFSLKVEARALEVLAPPPSASAQARSSDSLTNSSSLS